MKAALSDRYIKAMDAGEFVEDRERRTVWDDTQTGLGLVVHRSGTKSWILRYSLRGRISSTTLGQWPDVPYAQAKAKAQKLRGGIADGVSPAKAKKDGLTVADLIERFGVDYIPGLAESTRKTYKQILRDHVAPVIGKMPLDEVGLTEAARVHHALRKHPRTANQTLAVLQRMLHLAERWGLRKVGTNPCKAIERFPEAKRDRYLTVAEMKRLGDRLRKLEDGWNPYAVAALRFAMLTGMRRGEVLGLRWSQIKGDAVVFTDRKKNAATASKTGAKTIQLSSPAKAILDGLTRQLGCPYVFAGEEGGKCTGSLRNLWDKVRAKTTFKDVRIHDLRHTFASVAVMEGLSLEQIGGLLGHKAAATTKRYAHLMQEAAQVAASKAGNAVAELLG